MQLFDEFNGPWTNRQNDLNNLIGYENQHLNLHTIIFYINSTNDSILQQAEIDKVNCRVDSDAYP